MINKTYHIDPVNGDDANDGLTPLSSITVSYTHLTLPTKRIV